jgi:hypothetical protein
MRANLGFLLVGLGLVGVYIALGGKFKGSTSTPKAPGTADQVGIANMGTTQPGGAHQPANVPNLTPVVGPGETPKDPTTGSPTGSGGESIQSRLTQLGHMLVLYPTDRHASRGGFGR